MCMCMCMCVTYIKHYTHHSIMMEGRMMAGDCEYCRTSLTTPGQLLVSLVATVTIFGSPLYVHVQHTTCIRTMYYIRIVM